MHGKLAGRSWVFDGDVRWIGRIGSAWRPIIKIDERPEHRVRDRAWSEDACEGQSEIEYGAFKADRARPAVEDGDPCFGFSCRLIEFIIDMLRASRADAVGPIRARCREGAVESLEEAQCDGMIGDANGNGVEVCTGEVADLVWGIESSGQDERERAGREGFEESCCAWVEVSDAGGPVDRMDVADEGIERGSAFELVDGSDRAIQPRVGGESVDGLGGDGNRSTEPQESAGLFEIDAWAGHGRQEDIRSVRQGRVTCRNRRSPAGIAVGRSVRGESVVSTVRLHLHKIFSKRQDNIWIQRFDRVVS